MFLQIGKGMAQTVPDAFLKVYESEVAELETSLTVTRDQWKNRIMGMSTRGALWLLVSTLSDIHILST
jgi:hypothetical protein